MKRKLTKKETKYIHGIYLLKYTTMYLLMHIAELNSVDTEVLHCPLFIENLSDAILPREYLKKKFLMKSYTIEFIKNPKSSIKQILVIDFENITDVICKASSEVFVKDIDKDRNPISDYRYNANEFIWAYLQLMNQKMYEFATSCGKLITKPSIEDDAYTHGIVNSLCAKYDIGCKDYLGDILIARYNYSNKDKEDETKNSEPVDAYIENDVDDALQRLKLVLIRTTQIDYLYKFWGIWFNENFDIISFNNPIENISFIQLTEYNCFGGFAPFTMHEGMDISHYYRNQSKNSRFIGTCTYYKKDTTDEIWNDHIVVFYNDNVIIDDRWFPIITSKPMPTQLKNLYCCAIQSIFHELRHVQQIIIDNLELESSDEAVNIMKSLTTTYSKDCYDHEIDAYAYQGRMFKLFVNECGIYETYLIQKESAKMYYDFFQNIYAGNIKAESNIETFSNLIEFNKTWSDLEPWIENEKKTE